MLSRPIPLEFVKPVAGWDFQVVEAGSQVDVLQLSRRPLGDVRWEPFRLARRVELLSMPIRERLDHVCCVICHVTHVKPGRPARGSAGFDATRWSTPRSKSPQRPFSLALGLPRFFFRTLRNSGELGAVHSWRARPEVGGRLVAMTNALREELFKLSAAERLELVEELWDSIADEHEALALTDEQRGDLERRLAEADADPSGGSPWEDVRERIRHRPR